MSDDARGTVVPLVFSPHATKRRIEMGLTTEEILTTVREPSMVYASPRHPQRRRCYVREPLVVVVDIKSGKSHTVITVLWHRQASRNGS